jgi:hypothetical protein
MTTYSFMHIVTPGNLLKYLPQDLYQEESHQIDLLGSQRPTTKYFHAQTDLNSIGTEREISF